MTPATAAWAWSDKLDHVERLFDGGLDRWHWSYVADSVKYEVLNRACARNGDLAFARAVMGADWVLDNHPPKFIIEQARKEIQ